ncbi:MAG: quinolinate synthase NadA [Coriobacteriia bacterium]|nr:quinolinate synthase NadA [Coriobacteriia bacterium]
MSERVDISELTAEVRRLAAKRDAVVLAHNYQRPEVQDAADFVGDSLGLARQAALAQARTIVFAGVRFMAETAKILAPDRAVLMPEVGAGCPMADMITAEQALAFKQAHPGVPLVTYVNSSAEVKAVSDVCCTSANAIEVVRSLGVGRVLFAPDRNLAAWVASRVPEVEVIAWDGFCPAHEQVTAEALLAQKQEHPEAEVLAHPECRPEVLALADAVLSTSGMLRYAAASASEEFIVVTEEGLLHGLAKAAPGKRFYGLHPAVLCPNMKLTTLAKVRDCLRDGTGAVEVPDEVRIKAAQAVERMVAIG